MGDAFVSTFGERTQRARQMRSRCQTGGHKLVKRERTATKRLEGRQRIPACLGMGMKQKDSLDQGIICEEKLVDCLVDTLCPKNWLTVVLFPS